MGLLEKAQRKKQLLEELLDERGDATKPFRVVDRVETQAKLKPVGLKEKAHQKEQKLKDLGKKTVARETTAEPKPEMVYNGLKDEEEKHLDVVDERRDFGWKGLGSRRIVFNHNINEHMYEVSEPVLEESEVEIKDELTHLFKMLADVDVYGMDKEEKEKYLEETLEQIITDNDVSFKIQEEDKTDSKGVRGLARLRGKSKRRKTKQKDTSVSSKPVKKTSFSRIIKSKIKSIFKRDKKERKNEPLQTKRELTVEEQKAKDKIFYHIFREFIGYGKIDIIMEDEGIEDISCDGHHVPVFIYHKKYEAIPTNIFFDDSEELDSFVVRLSQVCGKQISIYSPIVDGKLPDGSRLQTTLAKTVTRGSTFTIRRFHENPLTPIDLIKFDTLSLDMAAYFWMAIEKNASILFCGGTASGKTTALNALSLFIPAAHKIISIEDTREVNLPHKNWIAGTTRQGFSSTDEHKTGKDIDMFDLIRAALRQRPRVIIVGEVRGKEAYNLFQAMATGHTSYSTVHASDIHTLIQRLENPPISLPRALLTSLDIIVFQNAVDIGGKMLRRMTSITEVIKLDPDTNQLIFMEPFRWVSKTDDRFESSDTSKILSNIMIQNDWTEEQLDEELENRKTILKWMVKKNIRDYKEVGRIVSEYSKYPDILLKRAKEEMKK